MLTNTRNISFKYYLCLKKMELSDATPVWHYSPYPLKLPIFFENIGFLFHVSWDDNSEPLLLITSKWRKMRRKKKSIKKQITKIKVNNQWIWGKGTVGSGYLKFTTPPDECSSIPTPGVWEKEKKKEKEGLPSTHFQHAEFQTSASCIQESQVLSGGLISALPQVFHTFPQGFRTGTYLKKLNKKIARELAKHNNGLFLIILPCVFWINMETVIIIKSE